MRIMILADEPEPALWDYLDRSRLEGIDLILSCGDLPAEYLSFLTCFTHAPIVYVRGNHDGKYAEDHNRLLAALRAAGLMPDGSAQT